MFVFFCCGMLFLLIGSNGVEKIVGSLIKLCLFRSNIFSSKILYFVILFCFFKVVNVRVVFSFFIVSIFTS